ncbi:hypothetical protein COLO4_24425 [Corchorus olitorius]|uniref:Uncharacterized protein n=1 Tax=Corchorus olitorius TaxID=93759 RepID=A0A1R3IA72_9ROSI|nr:hypothetical protein COLO4_24425 [Corchorus olitorius]
MSCLLNCPMMLGSILSFVVSVLPHDESACFALSNLSLPL